MIPRRRLRTQSVLVLLLLVLSCSSSVSPDGEPASNPNAVHPSEVTAVRVLVDRTAPEQTGGAHCRCVRPASIARPRPEEPFQDYAAVCLTARGFLIARMSAAFTNRSGADLLVYEWGSQQGGTDDPFSVYVSENGHQWILVAEAVQDDSDSTYASIELGDKHGDYLYVKIIPADGQNRGIEGPEILAIEALHPSAEFGF